MIQAYAVHAPGGRLQLFEYDPGDLATGQVEIDWNPVLMCLIINIQERRSI